jgi:hypothetical protein
MFDLKINKVFKDPDTLLDIYVVSLQFGDKYYNLNLTKEEIQKLTNRLKSIIENNELD